MIGYAFTGSYCTHAASLSALQHLISDGYEVLPIMSENAYSTDTRFGRAEDLIDQVEALTKRKIIHTVKDAEPLGPSEIIDTLIISPCTGNTLAKIAEGITDTAVTMAAKARLRRDGNILIALATNDAMSQNLKSISRLLTRRSVYFLPMKQDDPINKPHSLVAKFELLPEALLAMKESRQLRPLFL